MTQDGVVHFTPYVLTYDPILAYDPVLTYDHGHVFWCKNNSEL